MTYTYSIIVLLGFWFLISILNQFRLEWFKSIKYRDIFALIPSWSFFAPNPGRTDYHLMTRFETKKETITPWQDLSINHKTTISGIWNPRKRMQKTLTDCTSEIKYLKVDYNTDSIELTNAYLTILSIALTFRHPDATKIQFSIIETYGHFNPTQPNPILISNWHNI